MPELPEVETVRRGLAPAMEGARFAKVEVRDRRLRWPIAKDFEKRLEGKTVAGLGRRAKYLLADLSSGDVLLMHLGMSGSFRVGKDAKRRRLLSRAWKEHEARPCGVSHVERRNRHLQRSAPLRLDEAGAARQARCTSRCCARSGPNRLGNEFDAAMLAKACAGKKTSLKAALSDQRVVAGPRQYLCLRGAVPRAAVAEATGLHHRRPQRQAERARGGAGRGHQGGAARRHQGRRLIACATTAAPTARSATSSTISGSMTARASRARTARARSNASCRTAARRSIVRAARSNAPVMPGLTRDP